MTKNNKKLLVEVGSGASPREGYIHCDIRPKEHVEYVCNAWAIPFKENSVDEIYSRHMLEHLAFNQARRTLKHWLVLLKVGGRIDINVPDLEKHIVQISQEGDSPYLARKASNQEHAMAGFYGWQNDDYDVHKWGYTFRTLSELLLDLGYCDINREKDPSRSGYVNLRVTAKKTVASIGLKRDSEAVIRKWLFYNWRYKFGYSLKTVIRKIIKAFLPRWSFSDFLKNGK